LDLLSGATSNAITVLSTSTAERIEGIPSRISAVVCGYPFPRKLAAIAEAPPSIDPILKATIHYELNDLTSGRDSKNRDHKSEKEQA